MSRREAASFVLVSSALFVFSASQLSTLCLVLSPVALAIVFWYSLAKRVTPYTQLFLGLAMAVAPVGGWIAAGGRAGWEPWLLGLAIGLWVGGFDILYACQDVDFDRGHGLRSIPTRFGVAACGVDLAGDARRDGGRDGALWRVADLPTLYLAGVAFVAVLLAYEQSLVSAGRPVAGQEGVRSERLRRHRLLRRDGARAVSG